MGLACFGSTPARRLGAACACWSPLTSAFTLDASVVDLHSLTAAFSGGLSYALSLTAPQTLLGPSQAALEASGLG